MLVSRMSGQYTNEYASIDAGDSEAGSTLSSCLALMRLQAAQQQMPRQAGQGQVVLPPGFFGGGRSL